MTETPTSHRCIALVGNPNVGKTALFNALTGMRQRTANYAGVTVERREGELTGSNGAVRIVDLPGVRSLIPRAPDETVTADTLMHEGAARAEVDGVVVVLDATQLRQGLFLLSQVLDTGVPCVICVNMADEAHAEGSPVDAAGLSSALGGIPVFATSALHGEGMPELAAALRQPMAALPPSVTLVAIPGIHVAATAGQDRWRQLREGVQAAGLSQQEVDARWRFADAVLQRVRINSAGRLRARSDRLDRWFLHTVLGPLIFLLVMGFVFQSVFLLAPPLADGIEAIFAHLTRAAHEALGAGLFTDLLVDGVLAGVSAVVVFLPQILILFTFLILLEDSGYMARAAFIADRPFAALGLSGRSFAPLISSYACAVPGILGLRSVEDQRERRIAMFAAPLLTCSARLPVYAVLIGAFIPERTYWGFITLQGLVLLALYVAGAALAAVASAIMNRVLSRAKSLPLLMELPVYRVPVLRTVLLRVTQRGSAFLTRAGTFILIFSVAVWVLAAFPRPDTPPQTAGERSAALEQSWAGSLGHLIEPVIRPLGFDWHIGIGLVASLAAREVFNSTMSVVYAVESDSEGQEDMQLGSTLQRARWDGTGQAIYDLPTVLALLAFYAVALQCLSTVAVVARESGSWRFALAQLLIFAVAAWCLAWCTRQMALAWGAL